MFPPFSLTDGSSDEALATCSKSSPLIILALISDAFLQASSVSSGFAFSGQLISICEAFMSIRDLS
jgi:hypothetical protein